MDEEGVRRPRHRSKGRIWAGVAVGLVLVAAVGFTVWRSVGKSAAATRYVTSAVERGTLVVSVAANGSTAANSSASVNPSVTGKVTELSVKLGDKVGKGDLLFVIHNPDLDDSTTKAYASYKQSAASLAQAEAKVLQSQADLEALESREESMPGSVTDTQLDLAQENVDAAEASEEAAQAALTSARRDYDRAITTADEREVTSPMTGLVTALNIQNGDQVGGSGGSSASSSSSSSSSNGSSSPVVVSNVSKLQIQVQIAEADRPKVKLGQKATLTFDALPDLTITGRVRRIDPVSTTTQNVVSYGVTIVLDVQNKRLSPGMTTAAQITTAVEPDVLLVPVAAVKTTTDGASYVQVLTTGSSEPENRTVTVGASNDTSTEIVEGLQEGDQVVTQTIQAGATGSSSTTTQRRMSGGGIMLGGPPGGGLR